MAEKSNDLDVRLTKIGIKLRQLRKAKGFTNAEHFAYEAKIARSQYHRYEQGSDMHLSSLLRALDALEITPEDFFRSISEKQ